MTNNTTQYSARSKVILSWIIVIIGPIVAWLFSVDSDTTPEFGRICQVASIYDGDTMRVICDGERMQLRLNCIDAPEMEQKPWGKVARDYLRTIATPSVRIIGEKKDRYGRTIAEVWTHDSDEIQENLNLSMVYSGRAAVYPQYCKEQQYYQAQKAAQSLPAGIWEKAGDWQKPWEYRKRRRVRN